MRRLKGNVVLKGLYYLQSAALILINSSVMLAAPYPHQRELHILQLCRAPRAHSEGHRDKIIHVDVKKWDGRNGNEGKGARNAYVFDLFQLNHACCTYGICTHALCSDLLALVPYLWMELGLGCWKLLDVMQVVPILWVPWHDFPRPAGPSEAARLSDCLGCTGCNFVIYACSPKKSAI